MTVGQGLFWICAFQVHTNMMPFYAKAQPLTTTLIHSILSSPLGTRDTCALETIANVYAMRFYTSTTPRLMGGFEVFQPTMLLDLSDDWMEDHR